jgi:hypothetical protein
MRLDDPERAGVLVVGWSCLAVLGFSLVVLAYQASPPPPPPKTDLVGLLREVARKLSPSSAPSTKPNDSVAPLSTAAPSGAARRGPRTQPTGTTGRKPGESDIVNPWRTREKR